MMRILILVLLLPALTVTAGAGPEAGAIGGAPAVKHEPALEVPLHGDSAEAVASELQPVTDEKAADLIQWQVFSAGGTVTGASASYIFAATAGQTAIGTIGQGNLVIQQGFWQDFTIGPGCCLMAGDVNGDGLENVGDPVFIIGYIFNGGGAPDCTATADANNDCNIDLGDAVYLINYCFNDGPPAFCGCAE